MKQPSLSGIAARLRLPPAWRQRRDRLAGQAAARWRQLSPREQALLATLAGLLALVVIWQLAVRPAWRDIAAASSELPRLRAQAAEVDAVVQEALALRGAARGRIPPEAMAAELQASLARAGLDGQHAITPAPSEDDPAWDLAFEAVPAAAFFNWLSDVPAQLRVSVRSAEIGRTLDEAGKPVPARVSGTLRLVAGGESP